MLENALLLLEPGEHPIIHSDRGCHYRWPDWIHMVVQAGLVRSMSRNGCSPDNSACEGFFGRLKNEMFYGQLWQRVSLDQFMEILDNYLHWYNEKRIKLTLGGLSPVEYRQSLGLSLLRLCIFQTALKNAFFHGIIIFLFRHVFNIWQYRKISKSIEFPGIFSKEQPFFIFLQIG